ncbi:MAG: winged helix-turn-helix transcriptional regulator [Oscillospiraceae bacterium]
MKTNNQDFFVTYACLTETFKLSGYTLKVISLLIKATNHSTKCSFMAKKTLAAKCKCSISTISRALRELRKMNLLLVAPCMYDRKNVMIKRQSSNDYYVNFELLDASDGTKIKVSGECTELTANELIVYNFISKRVGTRKSFSLSRREIAQKCNLSTSTVYYAIIKLEKKELIIVNRTKQNKVSLTNEYSLIFKERSVKMKSELSNPLLETNKSKLSSNGIKLFTYLQRCAAYDSFSNPQKLSKKIGINECLFNEAVDELEHYQLLARWHSDISCKPKKWHYTLSAMLTEEEFPNALPILPSDVTNGEPFRVSLQNTIFALSDFTPQDIKLYCALIYLLQSNVPPSLYTIKELCSLPSKAFTASLSTLTKAKYLTQKEDMIELVQAYKTVLLKKQYFSLSPTQFTIYTFLSYIAESNAKVFITSSSISEYTKVPLSTVNGVIKKLIDNGFIKTQLFNYSDGGIAGRIIELVDKIDTGL